MYNIYKAVYFIRSMVKNGHINTLKQWSRACHPQAINTLHLWLCNTVIPNGTLVPLVATLNTFIIHSLRPCISLKIAGATPPPFL